MVMVSQGGVHWDTTDNHFSIGQFGEQDANQTDGRPMVSGGLGPGLLVRIESYCRDCYYCKVRGLRVETATTVRFGDRE